MACGCKGKKTIVPVQQPARITYVENGEAKSKPSPLPSTVVPAQEVENIVNKLNEITVP